jgi:quinol-cytochrome oxidoreductase complex cytochrome b subunit
MFAAILLLLAIPSTTRSTSRDALVVTTVQSSSHRIGVWFFCAVFLTLMILGMRPAEAPYVFASKVFTVLYFAYLLLYLPTLNWLSRQMLNATTINSK